LSNKLLQKGRWKKQFGSSSVNGESEVALVAKLKGKGKPCSHKDGHEDGIKCVDLDTQKHGKGIKCFFCAKIHDKTKFCRKRLWDEKHNQRPFSEGQMGKRRANVAEHKEEEEFNLFMASNKGGTGNKTDGVFI
jgi:hypothetical protein